MDDTSVKLLESMLIGAHKFSGFHSVSGVLVSFSNFVMYAYEHCNVMPATFDLLSFCFAHDCSLWTIFANTAEHID